ncbi:MAG: hypothetical protein WKG00_18170 [Polyangiaceae bacterium]
MSVEKLREELEAATAALYGALSALDAIAKGASGRRAEWLKRIRKQVESASDIVDDAADRVEGMLKDTEA